MALEARRVAMVGDADRRRPHRSPRQTESEARRFPNRGGDAEEAGRAARLREAGRHRRPHREQISREQPAVRPSGSSGETYVAFHHTLFLVQICVRLRPPQYMLVGADVAKYTLPREMKYF
jgi:hypothetical protein